MCEDTRNHCAAERYPESLAHFAGFEPKPLVVLVTTTRVLLDPFDSSFVIFMVLIHFPRRKSPFHMLKPLWKENEFDLNTLRSHGGSIPLYVMK